MIFITQKPIITVGVVIFAAFGTAVDIAVGITVGVVVGIAVGFALGIAVGITVGIAVSLAVGFAVGMAVGIAVIGRGPTYETVITLEETISLSKVVNKRQRFCS